MSIAKDLRIGLRLMARKPGFTVLAVITLALGIGANTAIFSVIRGLLLTPLPYPDSDRLVQVWNKYPLMNLPQASVSIPDYLDRREGVDAFEESALYNYSSLNLADDGPPERVIALRATASMFSLLQARPALGDVFTAEHDKPGNETVVVISHGLWQRRFGGDEAVLGRELRLSGELHRILGVMPEGFAFPDTRVEIWRPFAFTPEQTSDDARGNEFSRMLARLAPGATLEQAQHQIDAIHRANMERFPDAREFWQSSGFGGMVIDYREQLFGDLEPYLLLLQAVVALVLLIACANVANLLLTRLAARHRELAVRSALGAGRWHIVRQLLIESLLLALAAGVLGVGLGFGGVRLIRWLGIADAGSVAGVDLDGGVLLFTLALSLATGVVFSLVPILSLWRTEPNEYLKEGGVRGGSAGRRAALPRNFLVVAEVAMALVLMIGAGLLIRTMSALQNEDPGFRRQGVLTARLELPEAKYEEDAAAVAFYDRALESIRALPGVASAGLISQAPFSGNSSSGSYMIEGYEPGPGESAPHSFRRVIDEETFRALDVALVRGRLFNRFDTADSEPVVVIDRLLADKYFHGENPLGRRLGRGGPDGPRWTVVGVVETIKIRDLEQPATKETIYFPYRQQPFRRMTLVLQTLVLQTEVAPGGLTGPLRDTVLAIDPELPLYNVTTMEEQLAGSLQTRRVSMVLLVAFAALAAVLAAIGIYGVLAFTIAQRWREIGTRMALGAAPRQILEMVLGQGLTLAGIGAAVGVVAALALGRLLASMLFGVPSWDPATFAAVCAALLAISLVACYRPARRATRVDPIEALREE
ncbi:MAG: ABC transporter permease [bacterium]|nr:ABC transporter permease [bacterium]